MFLQTVLSFTALVVALPFPSDIVQSLKLQARDVQYTMYSGDGSTNDGWPSMDQWMSFSDLFNLNQPIMAQSCSQFDNVANVSNVPNDSGSEIDEIESTIQAISSQNNVDSRFILAIIMQESNGCVRAPTTFGSVPNPGLMQSHDGPGTCNSGGTVLNPCPQNEITQMVTDGTAGTSSGQGLSGILAGLGGVPAPQSFYEAARIYNSGSIAASGNLQDGVATHCYASDIANRLLGWATAPSSCTFDE